VRRRPGAHGERDRGEVKEIALPSPEETFSLEPGETCGHRLQEYRDRPPAIGHFERLTLRDPPQDGARLPA
jgi:hypothetical protein